MFSSIFFWFSRSSYVWATCGIFFALPCHRYPKSKDIFHLLDVSRKNAEEKQEEQLGRPDFRNLYKSLGPGIQYLDRPVLWSQKDLIFWFFFQGEKEKNIVDVHNFNLTLPTLEYHNRTWTWHDLLIAMKKDCVNVMVSQVNYPNTVQPVCRRLSFIE